MKSLRFAMVVFDLPNDAHPSVHGRQTAHGEKPVPTKPNDSTLQVQVPHASMVTGGPGRATAEPVLFVELDALPPDLVILRSISRSPILFKGFSLHAGQAPVSGLGERSCTAGLAVV